MMTFKQWQNTAPRWIQNACTDQAFRIACKVTDIVEFRLDGYVGDEYTQSDAVSIRKILTDNRGKEVLMRVNSGGGLAFDGINIFNALSEYDGKTTAIIESVAASAAAVAALGAQTVKMNENASFMIHESIGFAIGHAWEIRNLLEWMDRLDVAIANSIADKTGISRDVVTDHIKGKGDGTVFTAEEAKAVGYVHEIIPVAAKKTATRNTVEESRFRAMAAKNRQMKMRG